MPPMRTTGHERHIAASNRYIETRGVAICGTGPATWQSRRNLPEGADVGRAGVGTLVGNCQRAGRAVYKGSCKPGSTERVGYANDLAGIVSAG